MLKLMDEAFGGIKVLQNSIFHDERGFFNEIYRKDELSIFDIRHDFTQLNHSYSNFGVLRGLHAQSGQAKLIWVSTGEIFDVVIDLRINSKTYKKYFSIKLKSEDGLRIYIPDGFAHGFYTTSDKGANVSYLCSEPWDSKKERGIIWNDPTLGIKWPTNNPILSERDSILPLLEE